MKKVPTSAPVTVINDCRDGNAFARQSIRYQSLLGCPPPICIAVDSELEAQGNLIDAIDAYQGAPGIIIANVAPRGNKKDYPNGIPFCFHWLGKLLIIGTPNCFGLAKKLGIFSETRQTDVLEVCELFLPGKERGKEALRISKSQFRSYEYLPLLASWLAKGKQIPSKEFTIPDFGDKNKIWFIDNFGNCKTTATAEDQFSKPIFTKCSSFEQLADVPKNRKRALVVGSSGYQKNRFIEIVIQKGNASKDGKKRLRVGDVV